MFSNFQEGFCADFSKTTQDFAHVTSHIKSSIHDSTSGTKISIYLKKAGDEILNRNMHL